ncbi:DUF3465 domain-containing protein [Methylobacter sp. BlB1]|jgi:hypothetical protein|uniref:DUF3465 domain-containing protein n=1 Tax=Methylobacter sp. BlB1 TaxID=2785914 RepID=UPI001E2C0975|nr:DUF3465 domain-containing protein [Methylobacter sp. BlB1]
MRSTKALIRKAALAFLIAGGAGMLLPGCENKPASTDKNGLTGLKSLTGDFESRQSDVQDFTDLNTLTDAFENQRSNIQVRQAGTIVKILPDDTNGSRHQRFIVRLSSGQSVLIAHNIDLAPKVEGISEGSMISFSGEYEWNNKGGVIHWTHHDPQGQHEGGWLTYNGRRYE